MDEKERIRTGITSVMVAAAVLGCAFGVRAFFIHENSELFYFGFLLLLFRLRVVRKELGYLGYLGVIGLLLALLAQIGIIDA